MLHRACEKTGVAAPGRGPGPKWKRRISKTKRTAVPNAINRTTGHVKHQQSESYGNPNQQPTQRQRQRQNLDQTTSKASDNQPNDGSVVHSKRRNQTNYFRIAVLPPLTTTPTAVRPVATVATRQRLTTSRFFRDPASSSKVGGATTVVWSFSGNSPDFRKAMLTLGITSVHSGEEEGVT